MSVLSNTTVMSNFASIGSIGMLRALYGEIFISTEVYQEIQDGLEAGYGFYEDVIKLVFPPAAAGWIKLTGLANDTEVAFFASMPASLHQGEASCLAIALSRGWLLLTDDKAARKQATTCQLRFAGTLGCLVQGVDRGLWPLPHANACLQRLVATGFYSPVTDLSSLVSPRAV